MNWNGMGAVAAALVLMTAGLAMATPETDLDELPWIVGLIEADDLLLDESYTIVGDLTLVGRDSLTITGDLVARAASGTPGYSVRLVSGGPITVAGLVQAGDAAAWFSLDGSGALSGADGLSGGDVRVEALGPGASLLLEPGAVLAGGKGGDGQSVVSLGTKYLPDALAAAGTGGSGGNVLIDVLIDEASQGVVRGGVAGNGGEAHAEGWDAEYGDGGNAEATAGDGGAMGRIQALGIPVTVTQEQGDGGIGGSSMAIGGDGATISSCGQNGPNGGAQTVQTDPKRKPDAAVATAGDGGPGYGGCAGKSPGQPGGAGGVGGNGGFATAVGGASTATCRWAGGAATATGGKGGNGGNGGHGAVGEDGAPGSPMGMPGGMGGMGGAGGHGGSGGSASATGGAGAPGAWRCFTHGGGPGGAAVATGGKGGNGGTGGNGGQGGDGGEGVPLQVDLFTTVKCDGPAGIGGFGGMPGGPGIGGSASAVSTAGGGDGPGPMTANQGLPGAPGLPGQTAGTGIGMSPLACLGLLGFYILMPTGQTPPRELTALSGAEYAAINALVSVSNGAFTQAGKAAQSAAKQASVRYADASGVYNEAGKVATSVGQSLGQSAQMLLANEAVWNAVCSQGSPPNALGDLTSDYQC